MTADARSTGSAVRRRVPILDWLPRYDRSWLRGDIIAGIAVTAMIVPKDLGTLERDAAYLPDDVLDVGR